MGSPAPIDVIEKGVADLPDSALIEFKELVTDVLTRHASAILLDPEYGLPASKRRHGKGLLLAYEKVDANGSGRQPRGFRGDLIVARLQKRKAVLAVGFAHGAASSVCFGLTNAHRCRGNDRSG